jgi:hypothetical protein
MTPRSPFVRKQSHCAKLAVGEDAESFPPSVKLAWMGLHHHGILLLINRIYTYEETKLWTMSENVYHGEICCCESKFHCLTYLIAMALRPANKEKGIRVAALHCILHRSIVTREDGSASLLVVTLELAHLRLRARDVFLLDTLHDRLARSRSHLDARRSPGGDRLGLGADPGVPRDEDFDAMGLSDGRKVGSDFAKSLSSLRGADLEGSKDPAGHRSASQESRVGDRGFRSRGSFGDTVGDLQVGAGLRDLEQLGSGELGRMSEEVFVGDHGVDFSAGWCFWRERNQK